jgi:hypothetical protein
MEDAGEILSIENDDEPACPIETPSVEIQPNPAKWRAALQTTRPSPARAQLGLETDRPIVMSGHQPILFHCGILAKLIALDEIAKQTNAQPVWLVPDQDAVEPGIVRVPIGSGAELSVETLNLIDVPITPQFAAGSVEPQPIKEPPHRALEPISEWLDQYAMLGSLGEQFAYATIEYACGCLGIEMPRLLFASELLGSDAISELIETMIADPGRCARAYNAAAQSHPDASVRALEINDDRIELPLWGCRSGEARVAIDSGNIESFERDELLPRGVLMSAIARAHLCDLFIHGTGGWIYDRIAEDWFNAWLGLTLAPMAMTTATHRLDLGFKPDETIDIDRAAWRAHHARHAPAMVGDDRAQERKDTLVAQITANRAVGKDPLPIYRELQSLLITYRSEHADQIAGFQAQVERARAFKEQYALANDRTWSFVLFDQPSLTALDRATRKRLG